MKYSKVFIIFYLFFILLFLETVYGDEHLKTQNFYVKVYDCEEEQLRCKYILVTEDSLTPLREENYTYNILSPGTTKSYGSYDKITGHIEITISIYFDYSYDIQQSTDEIRLTISPLSIDTDIKYYPIPYITARNASTVAYLKPYINFTLDATCLKVKNTVFYIMEYMQIDSLLLKHNKKERDQMIFKIQPYKNKEQYSININNDLTEVIGITYIHIGGWQDLYDMGLIMKELFAISKFFVFMNNASIYGKELSNDSWWKANTRLYNYNVKLFRANLCFDNIHKLAMYSYYDVTKFRIYNKNFSYSEKEQCKIIIESTEYGTIGIYTFNETITFEPDSLILSENYDPELFPHTGIIDLISFINLNNSSTDDNTKIILEIKEEINEIEEINTEVAHLYFKTFYVDKGISLIIRSEHTKGLIIVKEKLILGLKSKIKISDTKTTSLDYTYKSKTHQIKFNQIVISECYSTTGCSIMNNKIEFANSKIKAHSIEIENAEESEKKYNFGTIFIYASTSCYKGFVIKDLFASIFIDSLSITGEYDGYNKKSIDPCGGSYVSYGLCNNFDNSQNFSKTEIDSCPSEGESLNLTDGDKENIPYINGGRSGGIVYIEADKLELANSINANGRSGVSVEENNLSSGGGSGGYIEINVNSLIKSDIQPLFVDSDPLTSGINAEGGGCSNTNKRINTTAAPGAGGKIIINCKNKDKCSSILLASMNVAGGYCNTIFGDFKAQNGIKYTNTEDINCPSILQIYSLEKYKCIYNKIAYAVFIGIPCISTIILVLIIYYSVCACKKKKLKKKLSDKKTKDKNFVQLLYEQFKESKSKDIDAKLAEVIKKMIAQYELPDLDIDECTNIEKIDSTYVGYIFKAIYRSVPIRIKQFIRERTCIDKKEEINRNKIILKEIFTGFSLRAPNLAQFCGIYVSDKCICIATEWCNGGTLQSIYDELAECYNSQKISENIFIYANLYMACQIASAISTLHEKQVCLQDLNPNNIFIKEPVKFPQKKTKSIDWIKNIQIKIVSLSYVSNYSYTLRGGATESNTCTPIWSSPEQFLSDKSYVPGSDIYSLATCIFAGLNCGHPLRNLNPSQAIEILANNNVPYLPLKVYKCFSYNESITQLLNKMWLKNVENRPTSKEVLKILEDLATKYSLLLNTDYKQNSLLESIIYTKNTDFIPGISVINTHSVIEQSSDTSQISVLHCSKDDKNITVITTNTNTKETESTVIKIENEKSCESYEESFDKESMVLDDEILFNNFESEASNN